MRAVVVYISIKSLLYGTICLIKLRYVSLKAKEIHILVHMYTGTCGLGRIKTAHLHQMDISKMINGAEVVIRQLAFNHPIIATNNLDLCLASENTTICNDHCSDHCRRNKRGLLAFIPPIPMRTGGSL